MSDDVGVRPLARADAERCDAIIASLPHFFGDPDGIRDCAAAVRSQRGWVTTLGGVVAGFLTVEPHFEESAEITWMAVHADHRRHGLGRRLIEHAAIEAGRDGAKMLCVLTLGPSAPAPATTPTTARARSTGRWASCRSASWRCRTGTTRLR